MNVYGNTPLDALATSFADIIHTQLKMLLESKHLYQSTQIEYDDLLKAQKGDAKLEKETADEFNRRVKRFWVTDDPAETRRFMHAQNIVPDIWFKVPDVKLFCQECHRIEPFNA